jgi:hypothetical protein
MMQLKYISNCSLKTLLTVGIFFLVGLSFDGNAQNIELDLKRMNAKSKDSKLFLSKMTVDVFASEEAEKPFLTQKYVIKKNGEELFYQLDKKTILINAKCVLVINDQNKTVSYSKNKEESPSIDQPMDVNVDSLIKAYDSVKYQGKKNGLKHYVLKKKGSPIPTIEIFFNGAGDKISQLVYHYNKEKYPTNNLVKIKYTKWIINPVFEANEFSEKKYIKNNNGKIQLVSALSGYELMINE